MTSPTKSTDLRHYASEDSSSVASFKSASSKGMLFGEIPKTPDTAGSESFLGVRTTECSLILCGSASFMKFWGSDPARDYFLNSLDYETLGALRLVCHDFKTRCAPALFEDIKVTFNASTFTKQRRLRALERVGRHVKTLTFHAPLTREGFLPPVIDPVTGDQRSFTYTPQVNASTRKLDNPDEKPKHRSKYGGTEMTELLIQQYPPAFHAATNVDSFIRAFRAMPLLRHLKVSCPGQDPMHTSSRRTVTDYALISLRIAVERCQLAGLTKLSLHDVHWTALQDLMPTLGLGSTPQSARKWAQIQHLDMELIAPHWNNTHSSEHVKLLHSYIRSFCKHLHRLSFRWIQDKGPCPFVSVWDTIEEVNEIQKAEQNLHPAVRQYFTGLNRPSHFRSTSADSTGSVDSTGSSRSRRPRSLYFPNLDYLALNNATVDASQIASFIHRHRHTLSDFLMENIAFRQGDWVEALKPLERMAERQRLHEEARYRSRHQDPLPVRDPLVRQPVPIREQLFSMTSLDVPCMLSPSAMTPLPMPFNLATKPRVEPVIIETLEPQPEPKEPGLLSSTFHRFFDRHGGPDKHLEYAPFPVRAQYVQQEARPRGMGHIKQLLKGNLFSWH